MAAVASETYTSTCAPVQYAAVRAFEGGPEIEEYLRRSRHVLQLLGAWATRTLISAGISCARPEGGFYLFPDFENYRVELSARGIFTGSDLSRSLLDDAGVATLPGKEFGRPDDELICRLAFVDFDGSETLRLFDVGREPSLEDLLENCPKVMQGVERIARWAENARTGVTAAARTG